MNNFKDFVSEYSGAIIGAVIAILILLTGLYKLIIGIILIVMGIFIGNYVQRNKYAVKEIKKFYRQNVRGELNGKISKKRINI